MMIFSINYADATQPVSNWKADGNPSDSIGTNNGTLVGGTSYASGISGLAFSFDGVDDYFSVSNSTSLDISQEITIEAWVYPNNHDNNPTILDKSLEGNDRTANYRVWLDPVDDKNSRISFWGGAPFSQSVQAINEIPLGQWSHFGIAANNGTLKFYINGVFDSSHDFSFGDINDSEFRIGTDSLGRFFDGKIDEVSIYGVELSESEIKSNYLAKIRPLKQMAHGVNPQDVVCKEGLVLLIKNSNGSAICVKDSTAKKLIDIGYGFKA